jgi:hypothetical protein
MNLQKIMIPILIVAGAVVAFMMFKGKKKEEEVQGINTLPEGNLEQGTTPLKGDTYGFLTSLNRTVNVYIKPNSPSYITIPTNGICYMKCKNSQTDEYGNWWILGDVWYYNQVDKTKFTKYTDRAVKGQFLVLTTGFDPENPSTGLNPPIIR